jgi:DNA-binding NarL/FixJ family response regulator
MTRSVLIVDDHPVIPLALTSLIEEYFGGIRALQASSLRQARAIYQVEPNLVATILDLRLPDTTGLEGLAELRALRPEVSVVVFSALESEPLRRNAIAMGAAGIIGKSESPTALVNCLLPLLAPLPDELEAAENAEAGPPRPARSLAELSPRQQQIWQAIAEGLSNFEIATRYQISLNTTKAHVRELLQRLGVRNRTEAATLYLRRPRPRND